MERDHLEGLGFDGSIILKCYKKWDGKPWTGIIRLRIGTRGGHCECGNEPSGFIKCGEFLDWLRTC